jgi:hypothetical protein
MTNDIEPTTSQLPSLNNEDPYLATCSRVALAAAFLKYKQGAYYLGADEEEVPFDTEVVPNCEQAQVGWLKWVGGEVVEERMFLWAKGHPFREGLGDMDRELWEIDPDTGKAKDPWSETATVPMKFLQTGQECTFTTPSDGGRKAVSKLIYAWRHGISRGQTGLPIIKLGSDSYLHKIKSRGRIFHPVFTITRWVSEADLITGVGTDLDPLDDEIPFA